MCAALALGARRRAVNRAGGGEAVEELAGGEAGQRRGDGAQFGHPLGRQAVLAFEQVGQRALLVGAEREWRR